MAAYATKFEDTAKELQDHAAKTQDTLVDAVENAEAPFWGVQTCFVLKAVAGILFTLGLL